MCKPAMKPSSTFSYLSRDLRHANKFQSWNQSWQLLHTGYSSILKRLVTVKMGHMQHETCFPKPRLLSIVKLGLD